MRQLFFAALVGTLVIGGCQCRGCDDEHQQTADGGDGGDGGGGNGGDAGDAGDAGDGLIHGGVGEGGFELDGGNGQGVVTTPEGGITLGASSLDFHFAWVANDGAGWVSKYDTRTNREVARYYSVLPVEDGGTTLTTAARQNHPSRTAVDLNGDVWVANRAYDDTAEAAVGTVTKIRNDTTSCTPRRPGEGIRTSSDVNDNGVIDPGEFIDPGSSTNPADYDDCVVFTVPVGTAVAGKGPKKARALAVTQEFEGGAGRVWVGLHHDKHIYQLDNSTGATVPMPVDGGSYVDLAPFGYGPYGMAADSRQRLWVVAAPGDTSEPRRTVIGLIDGFTGQVIEGRIEAVDPATGAPFPGANSAYGIAVDGKDRVWLAGWENNCAYRYDRPVTSDPGTWARFCFDGIKSQLNSEFSDARGIAVDRFGIVWMSGQNNAASGTDPTGISLNPSQLVAFHADDGGVVPLTHDGTVSDFLDLTAAGAKRAIGVGLDTDDNVWVNNYSSRDMVKYTRDAGFAVLPAQSTGQLYTYSDFTGYQLRHFTAAQGTFKHDVMGCSPETEWVRLEWDATIPPNTQLFAYVRTAATRPGLSSAPQLGPYTSSPADLAEIPVGGWLRVEFVLSSGDRQNRPELSSFDVAYACGGLN